MSILCSANQNQGRQTNEAQGSLAWLCEHPHLATSSILESEGGGCLCDSALNGDGAAIHCGVEGVVPRVPQRDSCNGMGAAGLDELVHLGGSACGPSLDPQAALQGLQAGTLAATIAARNEVHMGPANDTQHSTITITGNNTDTECQHG